MDILLARVTGKPRLFVFYYFQTNSTEFRSKGFAGPGLRITSPDNNTIGPFKTRTFRIKGTFRLK